MSAQVPRPQHFLAEWYRSATTAEGLAEAMSRLDESVLSAGRWGAPVHLVMVLAVPDDELVFCVFAADSAGAVTRVCRAAGIPVQRLSAAVEVRAAPCQPRNP